MISMILKHKLDNRVGPGGVSKNAYELLNLRDPPIEVQIIQIILKQRSDNSVGQDALWLIYIIE